MKVNVFRLQVYQGERFKPSLDVKKQNARRVQVELCYYSPHTPAVDSLSEYILL